ncbi:ABC transporter ATP-binding protein [Cuneatibacter sp. NSJ-177]|uniref:ABC transporter ATP-binding protein n=1 Tax=Cuneatibacter sp. NSJ-177 TaxID=2931401 RepID=UPI001FD0D611|nr:ABC transporter ATP-binding protein [Cuneatibacter sp. NSJ-177]MCJ7835438.1 ABC transporter ATP-binding protein [Cuneatibacter sp. NSJ-177]
MIEVKNLTKRFGDHLAVDNLSFTVEKGQIYGFLGPNGAGKSTTMNIMTGYLGATSGQVIIDGHDILEEPEEAKACIGFLPELPPLYVDMTVLEYMKFAAELKKLPKEKRWDDIEEAMETAGILDVADRLIKNLSKGYRQRVGLAQALLGMPPIIILDEPTVGLDPKQIIEIRDVIKNLGREHTVILSSHILSEISAVCDHILIISHGKLVASDTAENLANRAKHTNSLELLVKGTPEEVRALVEKDSELEVVELKPGEEEGTAGLLLASKHEEDIRERVFYFFAEHRLPILGMSQDKVSLEELFLELTGEKEGE